MLFWSPEAAGMNFTSQAALLARAGADGAIGVLYALTESEMRHLLEQPDKPEYVATVLDRTFAISQREFTGDLAEGWYGVYQLLTSVDLPTAITGESCLAIDQHRLITSASPPHVAAVARQLSSLTRDAALRAFETLPPGEDDFDYVWAWLEALTRFYRRAAAAGRHVIFTLG